VVFFAPNYTMEILRKKLCRILLLFHAHFNVIMLFDPTEYTQLKDQQSKNLLLITQELLIYIPFIYIYINAVLLK